MKIRLFCFISCLLFAGTSSLFAQSADSLKSVLQNSKEDTNKVNTLLLICSQAGFVSDSARKAYAENALQLSGKLNYNKGKIEALNVLAGVFNNIGKYDMALEYLNKALNISEKIVDNRRLLAKIYISMGGSYYYKGDYTTALTYDLKSVTLFEELGDKRRVADTEYNISLIYYQNKEYAKAEEYLGKASAVYLQINDTVFYATAISQLGNINFDQANYEKALGFYKQSLNFTEKFEDKSYSLVNFIGIGSVLNDTKRHSEALNYYAKALEIARELNDQQNIAICLMNVGSAYAYSGRFAEGVAFLKQAVDVSRKIGVKRSTTDAYIMLCDVFEKQDDFKEALRYSKMFIELNDSIFNEENAQQINELSAKYESEKKEKEIAVLNLGLLEKQKDQEVLNAKVEERNNIILATIFGAVLLTISVFLFFSRQQLRQKNKYQLEISKQQENTAIAVIQAQENERNRIAKDLHDGIGTFLSTLKLNLQSFETSIPSEKMDRYKSMSGLVDQTTVELRNIMKNLSTETLQEKGLESALQELVERVSRLEVTRFDFISNGLSKRPDAIIEINLYRVAQELINNCVKHAQATQITLQLIDHENTVLLMMEDNGRGFQTSNPGQDKNYGMGLKNISNRVSFIKGTLKIESILEKGSTFVIETPKHLA